MIEKRDINGIPIKDESGKYVYETNYEFLFGPALRKDSNQVNLLNTATGGINSAFKKYFDWKLNNSNV